MSGGELRLTDRDGQSRFTATVSRHIVRDQEVSLAFTGTLADGRSCLGKCQLERAGKHATGSALLRPQGEEAILCAIAAELDTGGVPVRIRGSWLALGDEQPWGLEVDLYQ